jgi:Ca2+-transporting ATPase
MAVSSIIIGLQILFIFVGGQALHVVPLTAPQWAISLVLGLLTLVVGALTRFIPNWSLKTPGILRRIARLPAAQANEQV